MKKDIFGRALLDYYLNRKSEDIITWTSISDKDRLPLSFLFRSYDEMPLIERTALHLIKGNVLDVGCGAGSHALWIQKKGYKVKAIDISAGAIEVCRKRGINNVECKDLINESGLFDTILLLMNGTGIFQRLSRVSYYLHHLRSLLNNGGQILIDSSDLSYMYTQEGDSETNLELELEDQYYGELDYYLSYKEEEESPLKWLYLDYQTLNNCCATAGLNCTKVIDGPHHDYLARITLKNI